MLKETLPTSRLSSDVPFSAPSNDRNTQFDGNVWAKTTLDNKENVISAKITRINPLCFTNYHTLLIPSKKILPTLIYPDCSRNKFRENYN